MRRRQHEVGRDHGAGAELAAGGFDLDHRAAHAVRVARDGAAHDRLGGRRDKGRGEKGEMEGAWLL